MKWVLICREHINMTNVDAFKWQNGTLYVHFNSDPYPAKYPDPDKELYFKMCRSQGLRPDEEE